MGRVCCDTSVKLVLVSAHRATHFLEANILIESALERSSALESYYVIVFACTCRAIMVDLFAHCVRA